MKTFFHSFMLIALLSVNPAFAFISETCPLRHDEFAELQKAIRQLTTDVSVPADCQTKQKMIQDAGKKLDQASLNLNTLLLSDPSMRDPSKGMLYARDAVNGLQSLSDLLLAQNDKCIEAMMNSGDYIKSYIDVATGLGPFLLLFGGPTAVPWAVGTNITGTAIKSAITYYKGRSINMKDVREREAFIDHSCSFHAIYQTVLALQQMDLHVQNGENDERYHRLLKQLEVLKSREPMVLADGRMQLRTQVIDDLKKVQIITEDIEKIRNNDLLVFQTLMQYLKNGPAQAAVDRLVAYANELLSVPEFHDKAWPLLERVSAYKKVYIDDAQSTYYRPDKFEQNLKNARNWPLELQRLLNEQLAVLEMESGVNSTSMREYRKWAEDYRKLQTKTREFDMLQKLLVSDERHIDLSEIIQEQKNIQHILFADKGIGITKINGPVRSWIELKIELVSSGIDEFNAKRKLFFRQSSNKDEACPLGISTWKNWNDATTHLAAMKLYCTTFNSILNKVENQSLYKICFSPKHGRKKFEEKMEKLKPVQIEFQRTFDRLDCQ